MDGLHGGDDVERGQAVHVAGVQHLDVLDAVAQAGRAALALLLTQRRENIEHVVVGPVADGVDGQAQAAGGRLARPLQHLLFVGDDDAQIVRFALVGGDHRRRLGAERPVGENLDATNSQPVVAEAGAQAHAQRVLQPVDGHVLDHAQSQLTALAQHLKRLEAVAAVEVV